MYPPFDRLAVANLRWHLSRLQTAPQFAAVVDFLFQLPVRTVPGIAELAVVDDALLFARGRGDERFGYYVGRRDDLAINLLGFVDHLKLGVAARAFVLERIDSIPHRATAAIEG